MNLFAIFYRFNAYRNDDGKLNVNVNKVNPDNGKLKLDWDNLDNQNPENGPRQKFLQNPSQK